MTWLLDRQLLNLKATDTPADHDGLSPSACGARKGLYNEERVPVHFFCLFCY